MENIDKKRKKLSKEFVSERQFDLRGSRVPGMDFWDEIDGSDDFAQGLGQKTLTNAAPYDLEIDVGDVRVCAHTRRITYVAVVDRLAREKWLAVPFSRYDNPASEKEFVPEYAGGGSLNVLQLWNARAYSSSVLSKSWRLPCPLSPTDLLATRHLILRLKSNEPKNLPEEIVAMTGLSDSGDEKLLYDYEQEERENFAEMDEEEAQIRKPSNLILFPMWLRYSVAAASLVFALGIFGFRDWNAMVRKGDVFAVRCEQRAARAMYGTDAARAVFSADCYGFLDISELGRSKGNVDTVKIFISGDVFSTTPEIALSLPEGSYTVEIEGTGGFHANAEYKHTSSEEIVEWEKLFGSEVAPSLPRGDAYKISFLKKGKQVASAEFDVLSSADAAEVSGALKELKTYWKLISNERYEYARAAVFFEQECYADAYSILKKLAASDPANERYRKALTLTFEKLD
ncbi:MAG: hypothetical protein ACI4QA_06370 [Candidatus Spyradosoma sp.]